MINVEELFYNRMKENHIKTEYGDKAETIEKLLTWVFSYHRAAK